MTTVRSLARMQVKQFRRNVKKSEIFARAYMLVCFWVMEIALFFFIREEFPDIPAIAGVAICLAMVIPDLVYKLVFQHDKSVMNAFLKTRPVSPALWDKFLKVSQFWMPSNLSLPAIMLPACFMLLRPLPALGTLILLYLLSVAGGIFVMAMKRNGPYEAEAAFSDAPKYDRNVALGKNVFGIQSKAFLRSKRMKTSIYILIPMFILNMFNMSVLTEMEGGATPDIMGDLMMFLLIFLPGSVYGQFGFGVESNFFNGIWSRPLPLSRLLEDKYHFCCILTGISALICLPFCIFLHYRIDLMVSYAIFVAGFCNLSLLIDPYKCVPFDLCGKAFFNYQGSSSANRASVFFSMFASMGIVIAAQLILPRVWCCLILAGLGLLAFCFHRPYLAHIEKKFMANRYKYMEKYNSKA